MSALEVAAPLGLSDIAQGRKARGFSWAHQHLEAAECFLLSEAVAVSVVSEAADAHTLPETGDWRG